MNIFFARQAAIQQLFLKTSSRKTRIPHLDLHHCRERTKAGDPNHRTEVKVREKRTLCLFEAAVGAAVRSDLWLEAIQSVQPMFGRSTVTGSQRKAVKVISAVIASCFVQR